MIRCEIIIGLKQKRRKVRPTNYSRELPDVTGENATYWENKFMKAVTISTDVQTQYDKLELELQEFLNQLPRQNIHKKYYINKETEKLLEQRKELYKQKRTTEIKSAITTISKEINRNITREKKAQRQQTFQKFISKSGALRKAYKELSDKTEWTGKLRNKNGIMRFRRHDIIKEATEFYTNLYSDQYNPLLYGFKNPSTPNVTNEKTDVPNILIAEIEQAIKSQKNDKTPGNDNIANEVLKSLIASLLKPLQILFNNILGTETTPDQWSKSIVVLIHKKGDRCDLGNYRPISLMTNLYKIFSKIILNRITNTLEENQPREQAGFRKGYSTVDHIQVITQIIEKSKEYNRPLYMCFIDYTKAFDSLYFESIWTSLEQQGVDSKYINLIHSIYSKCQAKVRLEREGTEFPIQKGVRQGDPLSPKIFSAVLEFIFRNLNWESKGIWIDGELLSHLRFADDLVVFAGSAVELESMVRELSMESQRVGLSLNTTKTKILTNGNEHDVIVANEKIEFVKEYIYLGQLVSFEKQTEKEIQRRITLAWKKYWGLKEVMKNSTVNIFIKKKLYEVTVLPCLTYGCQTWSLRKEDEEKIAICQRKMERSMLGLKLSDKICNQNIRNETKIIDVRNRIRLLKWQWAGHICRMKNNRWTKRLVEWIPRDSKRRKGRPHKRWSDIFNQRGGSHWMRKARERHEWKGLGEAYAAEATTTHTL